MTELDTNYIRDAYGELLEASQQLTKASVNLTFTKQVFVDAQDTLLLTGQIIGKNERTRDAESRALLAQEHENLSQATLEYEEAKGYFNLKKIAVDQVEALIAFVCQ